ncbi:primosomal protein N' [Numidum massiliense]|uniref:primosomal protein N' n=1 Tax=Numidum massiliense TaxID=1522315 RepID=UPI0006D52EE6|nr:primosomal protein N' [Numidum massiliense]
MGDGANYAAVIVDIAAESTDRPFDYAIPTEWRSQVEVGCRVRVPFGRRLVQGYVVGLHDEPAVANVRAIADVVDLVPPLNEELVQLARWMSAYYFCPTVTVLEAMMPAVLKAQYERILLPGKELSAAGKQLATEAEQKLLDAVTAASGGLSLKKAEAIPGVTRALLVQLIAERRLEVREKVRDRVTKERTTWVVPARVPTLEAQRAQLSSRAHKQREVLDFFIAQPDPLPLPKLLAQLNASRSTVTRLVELGALETEVRESYRNPYDRDIRADEPLPLTEAQQAALAPIDSQLKKKEPATFLLHGVTGSGKTEVYLQGIATALSLGREAIVLVPEISLTPQMVERFKSRFGERVAIMHSRLSAGERYDEWRKVLHGDVQVVIGARSAIFAPFRQLGLIIVDEEHESSYKQEDNPRYHVRDVAWQRARYHGATVVLGSATPALETFYRAKTGDMHYLALEERVHGRPLPQVSVVDLRAELDAGNRSMFSRELSAAIEARIARGEQTVLFLNRRGFSTFVLCRQCGESVECPHCDISLTYHQTNRMLRCHYCGYAEPVPTECPHCGSAHIRYFGTGTQKVEQELAKQFPGIRVIRMDVDTTTGKGAHEKLLGAFRSGRADVLLGTQMIAKGLDFPNVTLVGVIAADTTLGLPDFRASERTFQLLMQVGGRAGRHEVPGQVIIQTYNPEHYSIQMAATYEVLNFYRKETLMRKKTAYPPFCALIAVHFSCADQALTMKASHHMTAMLKLRLPADVTVLGPVRAPIFRVKDRYRMQTMIKYKNDTGVASALTKALASTRETFKASDLKVTIDRDPHVLL